MGKVRRLRQKFHAAAKRENAPRETSKNAQTLLPPLATPGDDLFARINIDFKQLKTQLSDDAKSTKSRKSDGSRTNHMLKKDKLKMRREMFLKKMDVVAQAKQEIEESAKRRKTPIIGDTQPLRDALPSLEALLKNRPSVKHKAAEVKKKKGIDKATKRKKELIQGVKAFKAILRNKTFQKDPLTAVSQHVQAISR